MCYNEYPLELSPAPKALKFKAQLIELQELPLNSSTFVEQMEFWSTTLRSISLLSKESRTDFKRTSMTSQKRKWVIKLFTAQGQTSNSNDGDTLHFYSTQKMCWAKIDSSSKKLLELCDVIIKIMASRLWPKSVSYLLWNFNPQAKIPLSLHSWAPELEHCLRTLSTRL